MAYALREMNTKENNYSYQMLNIHFININSKKLHEKANDCGIHGNTSLNYLIEKEAVRKFFKGFLCISN